MTVKDNWEDRFNEWKSERASKLKRESSNKEKLERPSDSIIEEVKEIEQDALKYIKEPKHIKIISLLIPILIIAYLIYANFLVSQDFNYYYDIGSESDNYLS